MKPLAALGLFALVACSHTGIQREADGDTATPALRSGVDPKHFDPAVRPQDDLYRAVNGNWLKHTRIPSDKASYGAFTELDERAEAQLLAIIEEAAAGTQRPGSDAQKVGDYYRAFMDEDRVNAQGLQPLSQPLRWIAGLRAHQDLPDLLARLAVIGVHYFPAYIAPDAKRSTQYIVYVDQGGLGLPDRDYYLSQAPQFAEYRRAYRAHLTRVLTLAEDPAAAQRADEILALETRLAEAQWTKVDVRDADKTYNKYALTALRAALPQFDFNRYLLAMGAERTPGVILGQPSFFTAWDRIIHDTPLPVLRSYLTWHLLNSYAPYLPQPFVDEHFAFYGRTLRGIETLKPRWKRGVDAVENALGEVLGRLYVARHFPPEARQRMEALVLNLLAAYAESIEQLEWMSRPTKDKALEKLSKFETKIGYPKRWKDYSALVVKPDDLLGNVMRSATVEHARETAKLGKPIDREEWFMTPQTVNAYYNPTMNEIVFPAAILQPPFFDLAADDAVNYGGIGAIIGHEIGHGFDDQGSKFDGDGNLVSWWTEEDRKRFEARAQQLIAQYNRYEPLPGYRINGALTVGENIGDLGGLSIAWKAWQRALNGKPSPVIDGLRGEERFFYGWAQSWREKQRDADLIERLKTDPHAPDAYRCNGVVVNMPAFYETFKLQPGDALWLPPDQRVTIW